VTSKRSFRKAEAADYTRAVAGRRPTRNHRLVGGPGLRKSQEASLVAVEEGERSLWPSFICSRG